MDNTSHPLSESQKYFGGHFNEFLTNMKGWLEKQPGDSINEREHFSKAVGIMNGVLLETRKYLKHRKKGGAEDDQVENRLSQLWNEASTAIRAYDNDLADLCMVKSHGWADSEIWDHPDYINLPLKLDQMLDQLKKVGAKKSPEVVAKRKKNEKLRIFYFGIVFIIVLLVLAIGFPEPKPFQFVVFKIVLALAAAGIASQIDGFLEVVLPNSIKAGGAIAVFVIVFFFNPAALVAAKANTDPVSMSFPADAKFDQIVKEVEKRYSNSMIVYTSCDSLLKNALVEVGGKQVTGDSLDDFLVQLRDYIRENGKINYTVNHKSKGRYEIICQ